MKCQRCEKPATFHITELAGSDLEELHLCEDCARDYLAANEKEVEQPTFASALAQHLKVGQTAEALAELDQRACPVCGITFYEFRNSGRLGCPHDYVCFDEELSPLIHNIHGEAEHKGKRPRQGSHNTDQQTDLIRLRREMKDAVEAEDYETASQIRDQIREIERINKKSV